MRCSIARNVITAAALATLLQAVAAQAVTLQGHLTYAGAPFTSTFSATQFQSRSIGIFDTSWNLVTEGTVDLAASTYEVSGLAPGTYRLVVTLSPRSGITAGSFPSSRDLWARYTQVVVADPGPTELDLALLYTVRIAQPFDSLMTWPGSTWSCPFGSPAPETFTLAWDPLPAAVRYQVSLERWSCPWEQLTASSFTVTSPSLEITQQVAPGETQILIREIAAYDSSGRQLAAMPWIDYEHGGSSNPHLRLATPAQRLAHSTFGRFVPQVARSGGVGTSYWTSTLTLTNPSAEDAEATLYFTARGDDGLVGYRQATATVPAGACRTFQNVLASPLATSGAGALEVWEPQLVVASRTSTPGAAGGTFGQGYLPISADALASLWGTPTLRGGGVVKGAFRTNLTLNEAWGEAVAMRVELLDRDGAPLGGRRVSLPAYGNLQINDVVAELSSRSSLSEGQVRVTVLSGNGRVAGTLSVVDNTTDDPTTIPLVRR